MTLEHAFAFFLFSVAAAGTPGPSNTLLTATGASVGVLRGLPCLLGVALGMGVMMFLVAFGLGSVILHHPLLLEGIKWCGAAVLGWLAWKIATAGGAGPPRPALRSDSSARPPSSGSTRNRGSCAPARPRPSSRTGRTAR